VKPKDLKSSNEMSEMKWISQIYNHHHRKISGPKFSINEEYNNSKIKMIWQRSLVKEFYHSKGEIKAFLFICVAPRVDNPQENCHYIAYGYSDESQMKWIKKNFLKYKKILLPESIIETYCDNPQLAKFFCHHGFFIENVMSFGSVDHALMLLKKYYPDIEKSLMMTDLSIAPMMDFKEIPQLINLWKDVFQANPEFFYCGGRAGYLKILKNHLTQGLESYLSGHQERMVIIFRLKKKIVGFCEVLICPSPFSSKNGGIQFCFRPEIRGKKLGVAATYLLLQDLASIDAKTFSGSTSNPSVMNLSLKLERIPSYFFLIKGKESLPASTFFYFVESLKKNLTNFESKIKSL
jgi:hypothetical protein